MIIYLDECGSTNTYLMEGDFPRGTAVAARRQTAGRGRRGHVWLNLGDALYMSVLLSPPCGVAPAFALCAAVAVSRAVAKLWRIPAYVKWSNDILLRVGVVAGNAGSVGSAGNAGNAGSADAGGYRKICGILCESRGDNIVVGVGLNLSRKDAPELFPQVGYVNDITGVDVTFTQAAEAVYAELMTIAEAPFADLRAEYESMCVNINREVRIISACDAVDGGDGSDGGRIAVAVGINDDGSLLCCDKEGGRFTVYSGEVSIRGLNGYV